MTVLCLRIVSEPRLWFVFILFAMLSVGMLYTDGHAQTVVISEDVSAGRGVPEFGVNRKHFRHFYTGIHFVAGQPEASGADVLNWRSWRFEMGHRYKRKFSETFSGGYELFFRRDMYTPRQEAGKVIPDTLINDREKLVLLTVGGGLYQRINFGQRGNHMGRYIDIGGYADLMFHARHVRFNSDDGLRIRERITGLGYLSSIGYGPSLRAGVGNVVVKLSYRASDLFTPSANLPEWPRFTAGIEFGMHP